jgi:SPP1 gp7 family putative phage head morphogenesis protein
MTSVELKPIPEMPGEHESVEKEVLALFRRELYIPILRITGIKSGLIKNSREDLIDAIAKGRIFFDRGAFLGKFNSTLSRELRALGAVWDRRRAGWIIPLSKLPVEVNDAIQSSEQNFKKSAGRIDEFLEGVVPEDLADRLHISDLFDRTLFRVEKSFQKTIAGITVAPHVTPEMQRKITDEYTLNMRKYVKDWTKDRIISLRKEVQKTVMRGTRYEDLAQAIERDYHVSAGKAKFLARQESNLVIAKYKEARYVAAGSPGYVWGCVVGSKLHPVRDSHKRLEGQTFQWDKPPITTEPGEPVRRNNPKEDFGCRCFARPIIVY